MTLLKYKKIMATICVFVLAMIFCMIQIARPNRSYIYEGSGVFEQGVATEAHILYDGITLSPGVYEVQLSYHTDTMLQSQCVVTDGSVFTGGLLTSGEYLVVDGGNTDFLIWLFESTDQLRISLNYTGGLVETGTLKIVETNQLWTMCMTIFLFCIAVLLLLWRYMEWDKDGKITDGHKNVIFGVLLIAFIASVPYLQPGLKDSEALSLALQKIEKMKNGVPVAGATPFLYLPVLLRKLGFTVNGSYAIFCCLMNLVTAAVSSFSFGKIYKDRTIGIVCGGLYTLSIFRICTMFANGAVGEACALIFMPLILYGFYGVVTEETGSAKYKFVWVPLSAGCAGLIFADIRNAIVAWILFLFACLVCRKRICRKASLSELAKSVAVTLGVTIWYLISAVKDWLHGDSQVVGLIQEKGLYIAQLVHHFWEMGDNTSFAENGMYKSYPTGMGFVLAAAVLMFAVMWFCGLRNGENAEILQFGKFSTVSALIMMWMSLNIFPWDMIQLTNDTMTLFIGSIRSPEFFLGWGTVFAVAVFGCCMRVFREKKYKIVYYGMIILAVLGIAASAVFLTDDICSTADLRKLYNEESVYTGLDEM